MSSGVPGLATIIPAVLGSDGADGEVRAGCCWLCVFALRVPDVVSFRVSVAAAGQSH